MTTLECGGRLQLINPTLNARSSLLRGAAGALLALAFLLAQAAVASELVHHWFHEDSDHAGHQCPVTTLAKGQDLPTAADFTATPPAALTAVALAPSHTVALTPRFLLLPGRAPPLSA